MTHEKAAIIIGNIPINWEDDCYSVCEYQEAKRLAVEALGKWKDTRWIPVTERLPKSCGYIVLSFDGLEEPAIGMYEENEWYLGDVYGSTTCRSVGLTVSAWMPLLEPYKE